LFEYLEVEPKGDFGEGVGEIITAGADEPPDAGEVVSGRRNEMDARGAPQAAYSTGK
jgi:hypothetical protein